MNNHSKFIISFAKFITPILLGFVVLITVGFLMSEELRIRFWPLITAYFFPPLGKESVIPTGVGFGVPPLTMALSIAFVDIVVALFLVWNYDLAKRVPLIGRFMQKIEDVGRSSSDKYGWFKPLRFFGIILFVMVPFQGSGGLVGSILGRLFGMKAWSTFFAISIGAIIGCTLIAYFTEAIIGLIKTSFFQGLVVLLFVLIIGVMIFFFRKMKKK